MQIEKDQWCCTYCGARVDGVELDARFVASFEAVSGEPLERVVTMEGCEVHRCTGPANSRRVDLREQAVEVRARATELHIRARRARDTSRAMFGG